MTEETKDIQNRFTVYLSKAIRNRKLSYIEQRTRRMLPYSEEIDESEKVHLDFEEQFHSYLGEKTAFLFRDWKRIQEFMELVENRKLVRALGRLKERDRKLLFAKVFGELSFVELGKLFRLEPKQAERAYYYVLRRLRQELGVRRDEF